MKKIILICVVALSFFACKSSATAADSDTLSTKLDKSSQVAIKGNWILTDVSYPGSDYIKVNSFDIADSKCFIGSTWSFISNNNKGNMSLNAAGCTSFQSPIVWSINNQGLFVLKILNEGEKSKNVKSGYLLTVANQTENSFQLIDQINVGGQTKSVTYQFQRSN
ncbi:lipocalin family protein [Flavobacterium agrisoli]|uniref:Lipocalin family protein n=1 Tax=Flavobacterium agrisoli TaxID=2793066 RepID=A0A934PQL8_9FLAO|nr:lipocalin family protein [Flavobacterium agrisoli]MBK0370791.1 lipocalin family protein [Flavobacterium agrisoli]